MYPHSAEEIELAKHEAIQKLWKPQVGDVVLYQDETMLLSGIQGEEFRMVLPDNSARSGLPFYRTDGPRYWPPLPWQGQRMLEQYLEDPHDWWCLRIHQARTAWLRLVHGAELFDEEENWVKRWHDETWLTAPTTLAAMMQMVIELEGGRSG